jgi:hypothetical protein
VRRVLASGATVLLCLSASAAAQGHAAVRGRVVDKEGLPLQGVEITAQSSALVGAAHTTSSGDGTFVLSSLPAGDYVVAFRRSDLVPVKFTTNLAAAQVRLADVSMAAAPANGGALISVRIDYASLEPRALSATAWNDRLDGQPLAGGLRSALELAAGPAAQQPEGALIRFDGVRLALVPVDEMPPLRDALRAVTIAGSGLEMDVGWTHTGLADVITSPGGDRWSGSVRSTLGNQDVFADQPAFARAADGPSLIGEYTAGGPLQTGRTWMFAAAQHAGETLANRTVMTGDAYETATDRRFLELRATHALNARHRLSAEWLRFGTNRTNAEPASVRQVGGVGALEDRDWASRRGAVTYTGAVGAHATVTAAFAGASATSTGPVRPGDTLAARTQIVDQASGAAWWAPPCVGCGPAEREEQTWGASGSMLLPAARGTHHVIVGYEGRREDDRAGALPDGGVYQLRASNLVVSDGSLAPVLRPDGSTWIVWTPARRPGLRVDAHALFVGDRWRWRDRLTVQAGVRWDRFSIDRGNGADRWTEHALSPRAFLTWQPSGYSRWLVRGGVARYADASTTSAQWASFGAGPVRRAYGYEGPPVNADGASFGAEAAVDRALDWFFAEGGTARAPTWVVSPAATPDAPRPARTTEWVAGVNREVGMRTHASVDVFHRAYDDLPAAADLERRHAGVALQGTYRVGAQARLGGSYTFSRLSGQGVDALAPGDWAIASSLGPGERLRPDAADVDLPGDVRHRYRFWAEADVLIDEKGLGVVSVNLLQSLETGRPYGAIGLVGAPTDAPGQATRPVIPYAFAAPDAFRVETAMRTDLGINYWRRLPGTVYGRLFVQLHVLNLFGDDRLLSPSQTAVVRTAFTDPDRFESFDPTTETPVQGRHWDFDPRWRVEGLPGLALTMPRTIRVSFGVRF